MLPRVIGFFSELYCCIGQTDVRSYGHLDGQGNLLQVASPLTTAFFVHYSKLFYFQLSAVSSLIHVAKLLKFMLHRMRQIELLNAQNLCKRKFPSVRTSILAFFSSHTFCLKSKFMIIGRFFQGAVFDLFFVAFLSLLALITQLSQNRTPSYQMQFIIGS